MNYPLFDLVTARLRAAGHEVYNPAEYPCEDVKKFPLGDAMVHYAHKICQWADTIATLPGWENSTGALAEFQLARNVKLDWYNIGIDYDYDDHILGDLMWAKQEMNGNLTVDFSKTKPLEVYSHVL